MKRLKKKKRDYHKNSTTPYAPDRCIKSDAMVFLLCFCFSPPNYPSYGFRI